MMKSANPQRTRAMNKNVRLRVAGLVLLALPAWAQNPPDAKMRDAVTHDALVPVYRAAEQNDPMRKLVPAKGVDPSKVNQPKDLLAESDVLCFGGAATLVPKRAVLNLPKNLAARMKFEPGSKLLPWAEFYAVNRGWITTVEVTRAQAEGNHAMAAELAERVRKSPNLVVATYQTGPISVLPPKPKAADAKDATPPAAAKGDAPASESEGQTHSSNKP